MSGRSAASKIIDVRPCITLEIKGKILTQIILRVVSSNSCGTFFFGISKPMVCQTCGLHMGRLSRKRQKSRKQRKRRRQCRQLQLKELSSGFAEIMQTTQMTKTTAIQSANHGFPKQRVQKCPNLRLSIISQVSHPWGLTLTTHTPLIKGAHPHRLN